MFGLPIAFASPVVLLALLLLPVIWYLLRLTPPKPQEEVFPPLAILQKLVKREETPAKSPWWLTLLRLLLASLLIFAMAGPVWRPQEPALSGEGDLVMVIDDGWASGEIWPALKQKVLATLDEAAASSRLVTLILTSNPSLADQKRMTPDEARILIEASNNTSTRPDHAEAANTLRAALGENPDSQIVYFSDGIMHEGSGELASAISQNTNTPLVALPSLSDLVAISEVSNNPDKMTGKIIRPASGADRPMQVLGFDDKGLPISRVQIVISSSDKTVGFDFTEPVELRNQIVRVAVENARTAGAVQLLDDSNRRRIVGLVSGQSVDISQPLLSPLYYINRALAPYSDIRQSDTSNIEQAITDLVAQNISALVLADIGTIPGDANNALSQWVSKGGMLIRFAGPRLAAKPDSDLLPVELHQGDRFIGGALSWEEPKALAPFERGSPFYGIEPGEEVKVSRQVMAIQARQQDENVWARLDDGTPLVTAKKQENGWLVLFHVNSDNNWSNLPLSGTFVEMLRRTVNLSKSSTVAGNSAESVRLPPMEILNGEGVLVPPGLDTKPLVASSDGTFSTSLENPPGIYGTEDGYVALNLLNNGEELTALEPEAFAGAGFASYAQQESRALKPWLLAIAAILFVADCIAVLWFAGVLRGRVGSTAKSAAMVLLAISASMLLIFTSLLTPATAQETSVDTSEIPITEPYSATLRARLAYVKTGNSEIDRISEAGLFGLTTFVSSRTALEPAMPVGIDIANDELAFYPILYWPIDADAETPGEKTMARVDAYMKQGGSILFDTRDQISGSLSVSASPETLKLREILSSLDIPPLEPVPPDHVLTKSFYLLDSFPGRYQGGDLWVEQIATADENETRPARAGDGVSTILITSNDFAGAWAVDSNFQPLFPTVPPNPQQRNYAYRVGVNILMYMMTGNYKADQVHIPALLERLGQ